MTPPRLGPPTRVLLPVRPRPEPQELLSSWLFRLAQANTQKLHTLCRTLFGERQIWNRDIDRLAGDEVLSALVRATGVSAATLRLHTMPGLEGRVYDRHNAHGVTSWVLPLGLYHRTRKRRGLQFCPACLAERAAFLLPWRLSLSVVCPVHGCVLHEACPACQAPVIPHRVDLAAHLSKSLPTRSPHTRCFQCHFPLETAPAVPAPERVVAWQRDLAWALFGDAPIHVRGVGSVPVMEYLRVARLWLTLLTFGRKAERLRALMTPPSGLVPGGLGRSFDHLDVQTRLAAVQQLITLFEGWPGRVVEWSRAAQLRRTILLQDMAQPPEWYLDALRPLEYVNPRRPLVSRVGMDVLRQRGEAGDRFCAVLAAYGSGTPVREIARTFDLQPRSIRQMVSDFNAGIRG
ncbi:TniQ family protein [Deinococcus sp. 14RED07]|uniref:TniQ family protein n=1 Tax=Deinococcus sp. 14RED07 TaxID=2745874 RepID=UPI001E2B5283|nr:TniQ family protein [Deinococcus sp. 14RED07]MCD0175522.1 TniQ family protein [Deinococcus sp. 14RED07]